MFKMPGIKSIIIPGLLSGIAISVVLAGLAFLRDHLRAHDPMVNLAPVLLAPLVVVPVLFIAAGAVAEKNHETDYPAIWKPSVPYLAGFLAGNCAGLITGFAWGMNEYETMCMYVLHIHPELEPQLIYALGRALLYWPFAEILSLILALFSLAGGYYVYRLRAGRGLVNGETE